MSSRDRTPDLLGDLLGDLRGDLRDDLRDDPLGDLRGDLGTDGDMETCREVQEIIGLVGDKWTLIVLGNLVERSMRFGELRRVADGISQRMLTRTLRRVERDGLVTRTVLPTTPPHVEYSLTGLGAEFVAQVAELGRWAQRRRAEIQYSQAEYDARTR